MFYDAKIDFWFDLLLIITTYIDTLSNFSVVFIFAHSQLWFLFSLSLFFVGLTWLLFVVILIQSLKHSTKHELPILSELRYFFWLPFSWNLIPLALYIDYRRRHSINISNATISDTTPLRHHQYHHRQSHKNHDKVMKNHDAVLKNHDIIMKNHDIIMKNHDIIMKNYDTIMKKIAQKS